MNSPGIIAHMYNSNRVIYNRSGISMKTLYDAIAHMDLNHQVPLKQVTIQTGRLGMSLMSIVIEAKSIKDLRYTTYVPGRVPGLIEISLFRKHGLCKVRYRMNGDRYRYECTYGGRLLAKSSDLSSAVKYLKSYEDGRSI